MPTFSELSRAELLARLSSLATSYGGTASTPDDRSVEATLTAILPKWFLGGRRVTSHFRCSLDAATHEAHFRESAVETSWGLPPPSFTVETNSQSGNRVTTNRVDTSVDGGGQLEFGKFRKTAKEVVQDAGWRFVFKVR
jgi:hypothetical protein